MNFKEAIQVIEDEKKKNIVICHFSLLPGGSEKTSLVFLRILRISL